MGSCASRSMFLPQSNSYKLEALGSEGALPIQTPLFSLQWPNIYNSCGKGIRAGKIGGIDMIILAIFYRKRKMERLEEYT